MPTLQPTTALKKISSLRKRLRIIQGGTSASKTFSILAYLIHTAQTNENLVISVVSESLPHLKKGAMRDFQNIMRWQRYWRDDEWSKTEFIYRFANGSIIEFFSVDDVSKAHGPRRDILFVNEANNVSWPVYRQLAGRTRRVIIIDFNPVAAFWAHEKLMVHRVHDFLKLTYKDNEALEASLVNEIEENGRIDEDYRQVYVLGNIGRNEGQIMTNWIQLDQLPSEARLVRRGLDFGYTNDPSAIVDIYEWNGGYIWVLVTYTKGLSNKQIADIILAQPEQVLVIGDSSEPKSIAEIKGHGIAIVGAVKGADSVINGVSLIKSKQVYVLKQDTELIKEERNYLWKMDKNGEPLNVPRDLFNHAMDAGRYAMTDLIGNAAAPLGDVEDDDYESITSGLLDESF
ncbi:terminase large subunit [Pseudarthrobacter sp. HLT3-5]|uniref:PBSX family phage terminase large subunit n=1 Tax=Pseudarthrobacter cellobiosi TaxID=2953654 RepID=UPI00208FE064|nr:terminase large subunit [Pseudarthrobacter sp. HLT3-5]MCO4274276.1 terminase large subunit [Pseudarthrobacter sp. HLT3-5]